MLYHRRIPGTNLQVRCLLILKIFRKLYLPLCRPCSWSNTCIFGQLTMVCRFFKDPLGWLMHFFGARVVSGSLFTPPTRTFWPMIGYSVLKATGSSWGPTPSPHFPSAVPPAGPAKPGPQLLNWRSHYTHIGTAGTHKPYPIAPSPDWCCGHPHKL